MRELRGLLLAEIGRGGGNPVARTARHAQVFSTGEVRSIHFTGRGISNTQLT
ncbi:MAG: hypothetical protein JXQ73_15935 [Phycisphaerae bacterium]|nr:hypothetical protein [Phycisphaerae bacterium]